MNEKTISRWYKVQNIMAIIVLFAAGWQDRGNITKLCSTLIAIFVLLFSVLWKFGSSSKTIRQVNLLGQLLFQPIALVLAWLNLNCFLYLFIKGISSIIVSAITAIYFTIMFIPMGLNIAGHVKVISVRILLTIIWFTCIVMIPAEIKIELSPFSSLLISSGILGAVALSLFLIAVMKKWGFTGPNIFTFRTSDFSLVTCFVVTIILPIILVILSWDNTNLANISLKNWLRELEAGIAEEIIVRYVIFSNIFNKLKDQKNDLFNSILFSAIIFGSLHIFNMPHQDFFSTINQVIFATAFGIFFTVVYLYSGQIWWVMVIHFFLDWMQTASSGSLTDGYYGFDPTELIGRLIFLAIMILLLWVMMYGKRGKVLHSCANQLVQGNIKIR